MTTTDGRVLAGRYALGPLLGRGGLADVHRATDRRLGRDVAVKLLRDLHADEADRARFDNEARLLALLAHPGLITVLDVGAADDDRPFLVLELVEGGTLRQAYDAGPLPVARVAEIGAQVADALAHVHAAGVVHRDVKPSNVLLDADGRARLADFGIARLAGESLRVTRTGATIGSPAYLSPEQVRGEPDLTPATDCYALGLVLLEALTARPAYVGSVLEVAVARLTRAPAVPAGLSPSWVALLSGLTAADPTARPTAAEAAARLQRLAAHESRDAGPLVLPAADDTQGWSPLEASELALLGHPPVGAGPAATGTTDLVVPPVLPVPIVPVAAPDRRRRRVLVPALAGLVAAVVLAIVLTVRGAAPAPAGPDPVAEDPAPAAPTTSTTPAPSANPVPAGSGSSSSTPRTTAPSAEPTTEPTAEPTSEPTTEPVTAPVAEATADPVTDPVTEPDPAAQPDPGTDPGTAPGSDLVPTPTTGPGNGGGNGPGGGGAPGNGPGTGPGSGGGSGGGGGGGGGSGGGPATGSGPVAGG